MTDPRLAWFGVVFALLMGAFSLLSGQLPYQLLGGLAILVAVGYALVAARRRRDAPLQEGLPMRAPALTLGERVLPVVFVAATVTIVLALAIYTGRLVGLW